MKKKVLTIAIFTLLGTGCQDIGNTQETKNSVDTSPNEKKSTEYYGLSFDFQYPNDYSESKLFDWIQFNSNDGLTDFSVHRSSDKKPWLEPSEITYDYSLPLNSELLSLSEYLNKYYKLYFYENHASGAYGDVYYKDITQTDYFEDVTSNNKDIEILRQKLVQNIEGFDSTAYLMDNKNRTVVMIFYWNFRGKDEELVKKELSNFDKMLSTFTFPK